MMFEVYATTLMGVLLIQIVPGPNLISVISIAMTGGFRLSLWAALGVATSVFVWMALAIFGIVTISVMYPDLLNVMRVAGGCYLIFQGLSALRSLLKYRDMQIWRSQHQWSPFSAWKSGLLVSLSNVKAAMMWASFATFMFSSGLSNAQVMAFAPIGFLSAFMVYAFYGYIFSMKRLKITLDQCAKAFQAIFGIAFCAFGCSLLFDGLRHYL